jgi:hypothetical protein
LYGYRERAAGIGVMREPNWRKENNGTENVIFYTSGI